MTVGTGIWVTTWDGTQHTQTRLQVLKRVHTGRKCYGQAFTFIIESGYFSSSLDMHYNFKHHIHLCV